MCEMCDADMYDDAPMSEDLGIFTGMYDDDDFDLPPLTLDDFDYMDMKPEPDPLEVKVRDGFMSKARSEVSYSKWERTRRAGSAVSFFKRQARRAERRPGKTIIAESLAA